MFSIHLDTGPSCVQAVYPSPNDVPVYFETGFENAAAHRAIEKQKVKLSFSTYQTVRSSHTKLIAVCSSPFGNRQLTFNYINVCAFNPPCV
jgi:hypothetical protein